MSTSRENSQLTGDYINRSMRYMLMLLIPGVLLLSATSTDLISLVYSSEYLEAAKPLKLLVFGLGFLTVFGVLASVLMGAGKPHIALGMALPIVAMDVALNIMLIPKYGLIGAAAATTLAALIGMGAAAICVWRYFKTLVSVKSVIKFCLASLVIYVLALQISLPLLFLPLVYVGLFALYAGILWLMKELGREDIKTFKRILPLGVFGKAEEKE
jgi:O-antigen/teichoic acid export membrane protein